VLAGAEVSEQVGVGLNSVPHSLSMRMLRDPIQPRIKTIPFRQTSHRIPTRINHMRKSTKITPRAITTLLHIITLIALINIVMKLLLSPRMTKITIISVHAVTRVLPVHAHFHVRTRSASVIKRLRALSPVSRVMVVRTRVTLPTKPRWFRAFFRFVMDLNEISVGPTWVVRNDFFSAYLLLLVEQGFLRVGHVLAGHG
jgi:hypothetical protein